MANKETNQFKTSSMTLNSIKLDQQLGIQYITNESRDFSLKSKMVSNNHSGAQTPPSLFTIHLC